MKFQKKTNKKFDYTPRYYSGENPYKIKHRFEEFRTTTKTTGIKNKIKKAINELQSNDKVEYENEVYEVSSSFNSKKVTLYIAIILVLLFLFIIDFDISIFLNS